MVVLYTIGFTKKSAETFFNLLRRNGVKSLIDIRISNNSQLAGFAKGRDLDFFVKEICAARYEHILDFAPTKDLLDKWHKQEIDWRGYETTYVALLRQRKVVNKYDIKKFDHACFLCSEETPEKCHRRLLVEFMQREYSEEIIIKHL